MLLNKGNYHTHIWDINSLLYNTQFPPIVTFKTETFHQRTMSAVVK